MSHFKDRSHAGSLLADALVPYRERSDTVVLGIPRGGVPVAYEIAKKLVLPLDVFMVRKLGVPGHEELAMGAISSGGGQVLNIPLVDALGIDRTIIEATANRELRVLTRRELLYRKDREPLTVEDQQVILVDDGLATGSTMLAGITAIRHLKPKKIIVAVPVSPPDTCAEIRAAVDEMHCLNTPEPFFSVGQWYEDFGQVEDDEVCRLLRLQELAYRAHSIPQTPSWGEMQPAP